MHHDLKVGEALGHEQRPGEAAGVGKVGAGDEDIEFLAGDDLGGAGDVAHRAAQ